MLALVGSMSEEAGGLLGATRFRPWVEQQGTRIDQLLVAEPTEFRPVHGLKGLVLVKVSVRGRSAHAARPDLGVNAIELMPLMEFAGDYSWGYNPAHIFAVEHTYGGPVALKNFVREAHKHGIAVLAR